MTFQFDNKNGLVRFDNCTTGAHGPTCTGSCECGAVTFSTAGNVTMSDCRCWQCPKAA